MVHSIAFAISVIIVGSTILRNSKRMVAQSVLPVADDALDRVKFVAAIDKLGGGPIVSGKDFHDAVQMIDKLEEFANKALNGSAKCRMQIPEVATVLDFLYAKHKDVAEDDLGTEVVDMVYEKLYGVCPKCGIRSDGKSLYIILTARNLGDGANIMFRGNSSGRAAFACGLCRQEGCSSKEITLYWDSGTPQDSSTDLPWQWSTKARDDNGGSKLFQNLRNSLPPVFAAVEQPGQDPVFILVDVEELKWRGLLYLLFKHHKVYYSPENLSDQSPQWETVSGETLYRAPVIGGQNLKVGIYAVEREALVSELCSVADIPPPLIKQVQASCPQDMLTVVYFCGMNLGVRYLSRDAKTDKSPPIELMF